MPTVLLTPQNARRLPAAGGKRTLYRDELQPALALRVFPSGARSWVVPYQRGAAFRYFKIGQPDRMPLSEAREAARRVRARVDLGEDPQAERNATRHRPDAPTVADVVEAYVAAAKLKPTTLYNYRRIAKTEVRGSAIGKVGVAVLTRAQIRMWGQRIAARAPIMANRAHQLVGAAFSWALGEDLITASPFVRLRKPAPEVSSDRVLSLPELRGLLVALRGLGAGGRGDRRHAHAARLLLLTLTRVSVVLEADRAEFQGLDGLAPLWTIPPDRRGLKRRASALRKLPHLVPLSRQAVAVLCERLQDVGPDSPKLFPSLRPTARPGRRTRDGIYWDSRFTLKVRLKVAEAVTGRTVNPKDAEAVAELVAQVPRWTWHNFRHTGITHMREHLGIGRSLRRLLLGHVARVGAAEIYDRSELLGRRRRALQRWADFLDAVEAGNARTGAAVLLMVRRAGSGPGRGK